MLTVIYDTLKSCFIYTGFNKVYTSIFYKIIKITRTLTTTLLLDLYKSYIADAFIVFITKVVWSPWLCDYLNYK